MELVEAIDKRIGEVRTDGLDMSIGEIIALHESRELIIQPEFQRLFRWSVEQRSRLIESVLLQLPIPSIFLIERTDGKLELIDGLQRVSSLIHFVNAPAIDLDPLRLDGCDLVPQINGNSFEDLPLTLRLKLKRTALRTIIKRQSTGILRYEMFKRLNAGGSDLSDQDIRNVNARMIGEPGAAFYEFLVECSVLPSYAKTVELLPQSAVDERATEELVLRFFATKNFRDQYKGSIADWLDNYMEAILIQNLPFDKQAEKAEFTRLFDCLSTKFGEYAFVKYRGGSPIGSVAPAYFEAVTGGALQAIDKLEALAPAEANTRLSALVESQPFRDVTGPGANSLPKLRKRIALVADKFSE